MCHLFILPLGILAQFPREFIGGIACFLRVARCVHAVVWGAEPDIHAIRQYVVWSGTIACTGDRLLCQHDLGDGVTCHTRAFRAPIGIGSFHLAAVFRFSDGSCDQNFGGYRTGNRADVVCRCRIGVVDLFCALGGQVCADLLAAAGGWEAGMILVNGELKFCMLKLWIRKILI